MHKSLKAVKLTMNNVIFDTTAENFTAAAEMAKKTAAINVATLDKLINFQLFGLRKAVGNIRAA